MNQVLINYLHSSAKILSFAAIVTFACNTHVHAQSTSVRSQIAELSQRFVELEQKYNLLKLEVENLSAENNRLKQEVSIFKSAKPGKEVESVVNAQLSSHKKDTELYVKQQYDKLLGLLSQKLDNVSQAQTPTVTPKTPTRTTTQTVTFNTDFPKDGQIYTVQAGDTLSKIARKFGSKVTYIQNANKITNPNSVRVGDKLFIPIPN